MCIRDSNWNAQYMQQPTAEEGAIIKRDWWQNWEKEEPPKIKYTIQSYDTAFLKKNLLTLVLLLRGESLRQRIVETI